MLALARSRLHYAGPSSGVWGGLGGGVGDDGNISRGVGFADLVITDNGSGEALILLAAGTSILLENITPGSLTAADFLF